MKLWIRFKQGQNLSWDQAVDIGSVAEWRELIHNSAIISTILWPEKPLFGIPGNYRVRKHPHEKNYHNNSVVNAAYRTAAFELANQLKPELTGKKMLVYAPLRGALPIWKAVRQFLPEADMTVYFPVTSSFVFFPEAFHIRNTKGRNASGRFNHILEMKRLKPFLAQFDGLLYLDEIVSGGMMWGYVRDMMELGIHRQIPVYAAGLADDFGNRSVFNRARLQQLAETGGLKKFFWSGCPSLITEDQKFLLGIHYADYTSGPHSIPLLDPEGKDFEEKRRFEQDVLAPSP
jgi:hypothetical protein